MRFSAPAFSSACAAVDALGIVNRGGSRARNASATWRGVARWRAATAASTRPPAPAATGNGRGRTGCSRQPRCRASRSTATELRVDVALTQVVEHLVAGDRVRAQQRARLFQIVDVEVRHAQRADLALRRPAPRARPASRPAGRGRASAGGTRRGGRRPAGAASARTRARAGAAGVLRQHLADDEQVAARDAANRLGDQLFGAAAAVHLGGVDVREAPRDASAERRDLGRVRGALSAICQVPCPTTGTSSGIGPNRRLLVVMR